MPYETEQTAMTEGGWQEEWADWWQGYWSDAPVQGAPELAALARASGAWVWRESAHEFDFGTDKSPYRDA